MKKLSLIPDLMLDNIYEITPEFLKEKRIRGIVFDIDNTLVPYGIAQPDDVLTKFLKKISDSVSAVGFVSNNNEERVKLFNNNLGYFASHKASKPSPKCINAFINHFGLKQEQVLLVGDQLFTDCLAAHLAGIKCIIVKPIEPDTGWFFRFKRFLEKPFIKVYKNRKN